MAPRKMKKQVARKPELQMNIKARLQAKRVKAEMAKVRVRFEEIERQCHQLKEETEIIMKQSENTLLKFKILKARQLRDFLRELVATGRASASLLGKVKNENP